MKHTSRHCVVVLITYCLCIATSAIAATYDDGNVHRLEIWTRYADIVVRNSPSGQATEVNIVGALGHTQYLRGSVYVYDSSIGTVADGAFINGAVWVFDDAFFALLPDGRTSGNLQASHRSRIEMHGGLVGEWVIARHQAEVVVYPGGEGGYGLRGEDSAVFTVHGGHFGQELRLADSSEATIFGGSFRENSFGPDFVLGDLTRLTIHGSDFTIDGVSLGYGEVFVSFGTLTGTLEGMSLSGQPISYDFELSGDAVLVLIPEPGTLSLLVLGGLALIGRRRNKHALV